MTQGKLFRSALSSPWPRSWSRAPRRTPRPEEGRTIRVGNLGEPPRWTPTGRRPASRRPSRTTSTRALTLDDDNKPIPMLAEAMPTVSPDGLTYTFKLRRGIKFHNGKEMTSTTWSPR